MGSFGFLEVEIARWKEEGTYRCLTEIDSKQGASVRVDGRELIQLSSNNYLGLTDHPRLKAAAIAAVENYGVGTGSVRTIAGTFTMHQELEKSIAKFKATEAALVFQSGFTANVGVVASILGAEDVVISDELNHASIIDGIRLTKARRRIYKHKDMVDLEAALQEMAHCRVRLVVTDGVFSMDGDIAPLPAIVELCKKYDALLMVDDAHASGVLGRNGRGTVDHFGLHGLVDIQIGTLSKAVGVLGGYVAGPQALINFLIHRARPFLFSTSHPPAVIAACQAALDVLLEEEQLFQRLWENTKFFKAGLVDLGYDIGGSETPIIPVILGDDQLTLRFSAELLAGGVYAQGIVYPTVAPGKARIRTIVSAIHTRQELEMSLDLFRLVGKKFNIIR